MAVIGARDFRSILARRATSVAVVTPAPAVSFASPALLLLLAAVPVAVWLYLRFERRSRRSAQAFARPALMPAVAPHRAGWRRHAPPALYALALAALIVALARPQATVAVPAEQATIVLATDFSGSMQATDVRPSRLRAAQHAAERFLDRVPRQVRVAAVAFNNRARLVQSPTTDRDAVRDALAGLRPRGGTATGDALDLALRVARRPPRPGDRPPPAAIVLLSDGKSVRGRDPLAAARDAARARVPVYTVALGTDAGTITVPDGAGGQRTQRVPPDPRSLRRMAELTGGRFYAVADTEELDTVFERLGSQVAKRPERREVTAAAAAGALLLVLSAAGLSLRWFGRVP
jgi:Ca-activated chloride channel family protein